MRFQLSKHGRVFSTRPRGAQLLAVLEEGMAAAASVEVDFADVRSISYSFADEFVGELLQRAADGRYEARIQLTNMSAEAERVVAGSLSRRGVDGQAWLGDAFVAPV